MARPTALRGAPTASRKSLREEENTECLGGMRNPHSSVPRVPGAARVGALVQAAVRAEIARDPSLLDPVRLLLQQNTTKGFSQDQVLRLRKRVSRTLDASEAVSDSGLQPQLFAARASSTGDPDGILSEWLQTGAPLGVLSPVTQTGVFPPVPVNPTSMDLIQALATTPDGWSNYRSSEDEPKVTGDILRSHRVGQPSTRRGPTSPTDSSPTKSP